MAWTYDATLLNDPDDGPLMQVRLLLGDVNSADPQMADEEILYFLSSESSTYMAAAHAARTLAGRYARQDATQKKVGDLSITYGKISKQYSDLADQYEAKGRLYQVPTAGGVEAADRTANLDDDSLLHSSIRRGMHDNGMPSVRTLADRNPNDL